MTDTRSRRAKPVAIGALTVTTDLRLWLRQPLAIALALIAPALVAVVVSNALGSLADPDVQWLIVDGDRSAAATAFREVALDSERLRDLVSSEDVELDEARRRVDRGDVDAAIVLPDGMTQAVAEGRIPDIEVLTPEAHSLGADLAVLVADEFALRSWALGPGDASADWPIEVHVRSASGRSIDAAEHYGPAIGLFFVMLALGFAAQAQVRSRVSGIADRLRSTPASTGSVVIGHAVSGVVLGGATLVTTLAVMSMVYDASLGPLPLQAAVIAAVLLAYAGVGALLAAASRTPDQALMFAIAVPFLFILMSGGFAPPGSTSRPRFAELVPPTHALDAFAEIGVNGAGLGSIAGSLLALVAIGFVTGGAALLIERRR